MDETLYNKISSGRKRATFSRRFTERGVERGGCESTKGAHRLSFHKDGSSNDPWKATRHSYGNQDEARGAIQPVGFHRRLTSSTTFRSHPPVRLFATLFPTAPSSSLSNPSSPSFHPCLSLAQLYIKWRY